MSHFAEIDKDTKKVIQIIVAEQSFINSGAVGDSFNWIQTSYNLNFRRKFAAVGDIYDREKDTFIPANPKSDKFQEWNEESQSWEVVVKE